MKLKKPILSGLLAFTLAANLITPALAYNSTGSTTDQTTGEDKVQGVNTSYYGENELGDSDTANTEVYATRSSTFTVLIPKTIILNGSDGYGAYVVGAKGDVLAEDSITIEPDSYNLVLKRVDDASKTADATITQEQISVTGAQIEAVVPAYATMEGSIKSDNLKAGSWKSTVTFNIRLNDSNNPETPEHTHNFIHVPASEATAEHPAIKEHWYCEGCDKYYSDANGENEIGKYDIYTGLYDFDVWTFDIDKVGYTGVENEELVIKDTFYDKESGRWYKVTSIHSSAFSKRTGLTSVTIPDTVTSIGDGAFNNCTGLTSITIPDSVTTIGDSAFSGCTGLTSVTIPDSVTSIGRFAFSRCDGLTQVTIGNSVTEIGESVFSGCKGLTSVTIPDSVTSIGVQAFINCTSLISVTIPDSVTAIRMNAFMSCSGLTSVAIPDSVITIEGSAFNDCTGLTSVTIPDSVTFIENYAFKNVPKVIYNGDAANLPWGALRVEASDGTVRYPIA